MRDAGVTDMTDRVVFVRTTAPIRTSVFGGYYRYRSYGNRNVAEIMTKMIRLLVSLRSDAHRDDEDLSLIHI